MLSVVCFLWRGDRHAEHYTYTADYVNRLRSMLARHLKAPHELVCCTDIPEGVDGRVRIAPLPSDALGLGSLNPKLYAFHPDAPFGSRMLMMDLDTVIVRDIGPLLETGAEIKAWSVRPGTPGRFNTSMVLMDSGAFPDVWERFDPKTSLDAAEAAGMDRWEQGWVSYVMDGRGETWARSGEGIESFQPRHDWRLPDSARIVFFPGRRSPAMPELQARHPWIEEHWR